MGGWQVVVFVALGVALATLVFVLGRFREALDGVELVLRLLVTGVRVAARGAGEVPREAEAIGAGSRAAHAGLGRLEELKERPARHSFQ